MGQWNTRQESVYILLIQETMGHNTWECMYILPVHGTMGHSTLRWSLETWSYYLLSCYLLLWWSKPSEYYSMLFVAVVIDWHQWLAESDPFWMHLVKGHYWCLNFLAQQIKKEEKFGLTSKLAIYEQQCKLCEQRNRQISHALMTPGGTSIAPSLSRPVCEWWLIYCSSMWQLG
jgi:hypothetical protein